MVDIHFLPAQAVFLHFVLSHYVDVGVEELDRAKLAPLLKLKYGDSIQDAVAAVGPGMDKAFVDFQKYLYDPETA